MGLRIDDGLRLYGKKPITISFEPPVQINQGALDLYRSVSLGAFSFFRTGRIRHVESIGRYTSIGPGVILGESEHPVDWLSSSPAVFNAGHYGFYPPEKRAAAQRVVPRTKDNSAPSQSGRITIGNDVWVGANAIVRRGIRIGDGAIIGANAFVNRDVRPYSIVGGLPARDIASRFDEETVADLLDLKWWEFDVNALAGIDFSNVTAAVKQIRDRERRGEICRCAPHFSSVTLTSSGFENLVVAPSPG